MTVPARLDAVPAIFDATTLEPSARDRFDAWWYGAAANTRRAFTADLRAWAAFRAAREQPLLPGGPLDVRDFVRARAQSGLKASSIARQLAHVSIAHELAGHRPSPVRDRIVSGELKGLRREQGLAGRGGRRQARPLRFKGDVADLEHDTPLALSIAALLTTLDDSPAGRRDRLLLLLGADLGRRRSEYAAMNVGDVDPAGDGSGTIRIRRSKTDQAGQGTVKYLSPATMAALRDWLVLRSSPAPLSADAALLTSVDRFGRPGARLSHDGVRDVLLRIARRGLARLRPELEPSEIDAQLHGLSGHSFRVGFAQDLTAAGEGLAAICQAADWSSPTMPTRYAEALAARSGAVARLRARMSA